jgi:PRD1 phage membrane DNA delivery
MQNVSNELVSGIIAVLAGAVGITIISVLVSKNAQTPQVLSAAGSAFSSILQAATSPVSASGSATFSLPQLGSSFTTSPTSYI